MSEAKPFDRQRGPEVDLAAGPLRIGKLELELTDTDTRPIPLLLGIIPRLLGRIPMILGQCLSILGRIPSSLGIFELQCKLIPLLLGRVALRRNPLELGLQEVSAIRGLPAVCHRGLHSTIGEEVLKRPAAGGHPRQAHGIRSIHC